MEKIFSNLTKVNSKSKGILNSKEVITFNSSIFQDINQQLSKTIIGQTQLIQEVLTVILSGGHLLINGLPGLAKTLLIKSIASILGLHFNRVQFTPDLMPSDLIGYDILDNSSENKTFRFIKGPIFTQILLADEINRSPAKTQSALLQAMEEKEVTVLGNHHYLMKPFLVLATQNPLEQKGTYELPEAQLDRFMALINVDYPTYLEEIEILENALKVNKEESNKKENKASLLLEKDFFAVQKKIQEVNIAPEVVEWIVKIVRNTRPNSLDKNTPTSILKMVKDYVVTGCSPRAAKSILELAKTCAFLCGKDFIEKKHIEFVASMALRHRIKLSYEADVNGIKSDDIIKNIIENTKS